MDRRKVEIFIGPIACTCAGGPSPARQEKITRAFALERELKSRGDMFEVRTWRLGDEGDYEEGMRALRGYLRNAGEGELADRLAFSVNEATPAVVVDGRLVSVGGCPDVAAFLSECRSKDCG